jgi:hypothetical protein
MQRDVTMQSPPTDSPPDGGSGKSRLDRELEEILSKNENIRLLPPPPKPPKKKPSVLASGRSIDSMIPPRVRRILSAPIVVALGLALIALFVADVSPLLSNVLSLAAVVCLLLPMVQRFRGPSAPPETRMWRGKVIDTRPHTHHQSPLDSVRDWWNARRG